MKFSKKVKYSETAFNCDFTFIIMSNFTNSCGRNIIRILKETSDVE